ncbi:type II toxin-antitoxin system RelE/ParE family toxin [Companilactobacillus ginsenosidimutans]|uniref:type II toxin-antitoxin system RelE/ParE family toxin n=1 Tax=Companilactobacillus ginsenosidimutans TaxID=1007676 RepID=UPI0007DC1A2D
MVKKPEFTFYERKNGHNEGLEFMDSLPRKDRGKLISQLKYIKSEGMLIAINKQIVKKLDSNIFEIRSSLNHNIQRLLYFSISNNSYIITHGFTKKTQRTPIRQIDRAIKIRREYFRSEKMANVKFDDYLKGQLKDPVVRKAYEEEMKRLKALPILEKSSSDDTSVMQKSKDQKRA